MNAPLIIRESSTLLERRETSTRPASFDAERLTCEAIVATGSPVVRRDERGQEFDEILDVTGADLSALRGASVLDGHRQDGVASVIGTVEDARVEGDQIIARLRFSSRPELAGVVADVRVGILSNLSIGYSVSEWATAEGNGRRQRIARKWKPVEVSLVAVPADHRARVRQAEGSRASINRAIRTLGEQAHMSRAAIDSLIDREASLEEARAAALDAMLTRSNVTIRTTEHRTLDNPAVFQRAAGEALFALVNRQHTPSGEARSLSFTTISDAARECLRPNGESTTAQQPAAIITRALNTTSDFPLILGDTVGRVLRASYQAVPSALRRLARQTTLPDFRERASLVLDPASFKLEKINEHGEYKSGSFVESGEKYKLATYGKIFGITRQALVNDDLGALADVPGKLGQQAAAFEAQYLVDLLEANAGLGPVFSDTKNLFDATHGNLADTGAAPDSTSLSAARLAMRKQTGHAGELIAVTPRYLVVPAELETAAQTLLSEITPATIEDVSIWSSLLDLIVEPRLSDPARWYLVAEAPASGLEVAYLTGNEGPQTETMAGWRIDGVETKVRLDFVAAFIDWRGIYTNPGAAGPQQLRKPGPKAKAIT